MALNIYYDKDADLGRLEGKTVAVIGYGSQGHAHSQNLHASGQRRGGTAQGLRELGQGRGGGPAGRDAWPTPPAEADIIMMTLPDELAADIYRERDRGPTSSRATTIAVAHGFNIHFQAIRPPDDVNVFMVAPKGPGHTVREHYEEGRGVPALVAVAPGPERRHPADRTRLRQRHRRRPRRHHRDHLPRRDRDGPLRRAGRALRRPHLAHEGRLRDAGRGGLRARDGLLRVHPRGEADRRSHLRGRHREHALLGLEHRRVRRLREPGATRDRRRDQGTHEGSSSTDIQSGRFARDFILENQSGGVSFAALRKEGEEHPMEEVGARLRNLMPWLKEKRLVDRSKN